MATSRLSQALWNAEATRNWPRKRVCTCKPCDGGCAPYEPRDGYHRCTVHADVDAETVRRLVEELDAAIMEVTSNG
jgi:hypothetical protein